MTMLIAAIGNPGRQYTWTRHNIGFLFVDKLLQGFSRAQFKEAHKLFSDIAKVESPQGPMVFIKPRTYVNLSGKAVSAVKEYYNIATDHILVLADDVNQPFGNVRLRQNAGGGGHKGIKSITQSLGSNDYWQMRLGIGRPQREDVELSDFVLGQFTEEEQIGIQSLFIEASALFSQWCSGTQTA
ncbi:Peptidyl-tRNA hydrolase,peptidyl-tRNA hydrolase,Peptidyl-tRNA hydrolase,peptidyl-tRNA hydrolase,Peptidyl-tRNA hydrolase [Chlamydia poikilotherma]|uniref:Peptidyl-tRNA hydrolase n=1 Tax=Chlamydia poikilotherma TaxID=1967783 RepID=A0A3B0PTS2_9CHLA|nr:aminoacyl-tRNA hydrolase [Chlamydia poikilotherma]SYX09281.1 Peptidyl-tRNA hydrolase,peptidyl-tRNA hydrolase,Peptidyl-tRNA hydrolase,peptidyl-tRNA hydrolase,Peptidyl-tRNA hydrolase [Chlamydia poikilotherma]